MTPDKESSDCAGHCRRCNTEHALPQGEAAFRARALIADLERAHSIALFGAPRPGAPQLSTQPLFGEARGKMFGVLECAAKDGSRSWLYAFSGQFNGEWLADGWVGPVFDLPAFKLIHDPVERQIKALGRQISALPAGAELRLSLDRRRRQLSRQLMQDIHALYRFTNFRGERASLAAVTGSAGGKPTGIGDCCAPKLLNHAAAADLVPLSLAEFYFGRQNRSGSRRHGRFYPPCADKCRPLLGFLLCGLDERRHRHDPA